MSAERSRARSAVLTAVLGALFLVCVYATSAFVLSRDANVMRYSSGIYDMDVPRVVSDLTTRLPAYRPAVHPMQKLLVAPLGGFVNTRFFGGEDRLSAARVVVALAVAANALLVGVLAWQLTRRSLLAATIAGGLCGVSFASILAASLPESAALACLASVAPLIFLNARVGRRFSWAEAAGWGLLGMFGVALTVSQIVHWGIALSMRLILMRRVGGEPAAPWAQLMPRLALVAGLATALVLAGAALQSRQYPDPRARSETPLEAVEGFFRLGELTSTPLRHTARLARHFLLYAFVAPEPAWSDFLMRDYALEYWSVSIEESELGHWRPAWRAALALALLVGIGACFARGRVDALFVAPILSVASQFALHLFYGREYILYAPHWHGVFVAVLVAAGWNAGSTSRARRRIFVGFAALLGIAMLANNLQVMRSVYRQVEAGLEARLRDPDGNLLIGDQRAQPR